LTLAADRIDRGDGGASWGDEWRVLIPETTPETSSVLHALVGLTIGMAAWLAEATDTERNDVLAHMGRVVAEGPWEAEP
jgi:hypothetical protein